MGVSDNDDLVNLDPSVAALLEPVPEGASKHDVQIKIATIKLQQARIRGNSDYAATVMEQAIEQGSKDRMAYELLDEQIRKMQERLAGLDSSSQTKSEPSSNTNNQSTSTSDNAESSTDSGQNDSDSSSNDVTKLKEQLELQTKRAVEMQETLQQHIRDEIDFIKEEQASIRKREEQLRKRIKSLQLTIQQKIADPSNTTVSKEQEKEQLDLLDAMKDVYEYTLLKAECSICHERPASRAVIPCGHYCLCKECTDTLVNTPTSSSTSKGRQCPLCRGNLLSTIPVYTTTST